MSELNLKRITDHKDIVNARQYLVKTFTTFVDEEYTWMVLRGTPNGNLMYPYTFIVVGFHDLTEIYELPDTH